MANHQPGNYNPHDSKGRFTSGKQYPDKYYKKKHIQYAQSDEWRDVQDQEAEDKEDRINKNNQEADNLKREEEIRTLTSERYHVKEKIAGAFDVDTRQMYERRLRQINKRLKILGGNNYGQMGNK